MHLGKLQSDSMLMSSARVLIGIFLHAKAFHACICLSQYVVLKVFKILNRHLTGLMHENLDVDMFITEEPTLCNSSANTAHIPTQSRHATVSLSQAITSRARAPSICPCSATVFFQARFVLQR